MGTNDCRAALRSVPGFADSSAVDPDETEREVAEEAVESTRSGSRGCPPPPRCSCPSGARWGRCGAFLQLVVGGDELPDRLRLLDGRVGGEALQVL
jgi:hypothetical protein